MHFVSTLSLLRVSSVMANATQLRTSHSPLQNCLVTGQRSRVANAAKRKMVERKGISPLPEELEYSGPVQCPVEGCGKELPSSACLRMHVVRRHHGKRLERVSGSRENSECVDFFCPVRGCNRSREGGEPFPRLGQLKQVRPNHEILYIQH